MTTAAQIARLLVDARAGGGRPRSLGWPLHDSADAYAVQDATLALLGPIGGWKVGAREPDGVPHCAPLPLRGIHDDGALLALEPGTPLLLEVEVALRLGSDLDVVHDLPTASELAQCCDAVLPAIEQVDSRLAEGQGASAVARLADLQSHGALVVGAVSPLQPATLDLRTVQASLWLSGGCAASTTGGNPAQQVWRLLGWLARHCSARGTPLRRGQVVTTGSCTGLIAAQPGVRVRGELAGIGAVELSCAVGRSEA